MADQKKRIAQEVQKIRLLYWNHPAGKIYWNTLFEFLINDINKVCEEIYEAVLVYRSPKSSQLGKCFGEIKINIFEIYDQHVSPEGFPKPYSELGKDIEEYKQRRDNRLEKQRLIYMNRYKEHLVSDRKVLWNLRFAAVAAITGIISAIAVFCSWLKF